MPRRNIYIRDEDQQLWEMAEKVGGEVGVSRLIREALRSYLRSREGNPIERLLIETWKGEKQLIPKSFMGRWLVKDQRSQHEGETLGGRMILPGAEYSVAETAKGAFAVYWKYKDDPVQYHGFHVYASLEAAEKEVPSDIVAAAASVLGIERAEFLDI